MFRILLIPIILFITACATSTHSFISQEYDNEMFNFFEGYYTYQQFDSICVADTLDKDLENWHMLPLRDYESKDNVSQYIYIKSLGENESIYRLQIINDSTYKITKRITR